MLSRAAAFAELSSRTFDALVIGGGVTGAGIARDATLRGLRVAVLDKGDFASGTSSRSSRLIHGGVRYLEHGHLHLVFEASAERRRLLRLAPHLVRPLAFTWPVYAGQRLSLWKLRAGLALYDMLALFRNVERHERLDAARVLTHEPGLAPAQLRGGVRYFDASTDDARLVLANVVDAASLGAVAVNHAEVTAVSAQRGIHLARVRDRLGSADVEVQARVIVNAAGPWTDAVRGLEGTASVPRVQGSKGSHIAVRRDRVGNHDAVTMLHPTDQRVMFALPAGPHTIIGTTDTFTAESPDEVRASEGDVRYLLDATNLFFPDAKLRREDVVSAWSGIRPLMPSGGSSVQASREHAIDRAGTTVTITGGKLTTFRVMARQVVDVVQDVLTMPRRKSTTGDRALPGGDIHDRSISHGTPSDSFAEHLLRSYGTFASDVSARCSSSADAERRLDPGLPYRMGEMRWAVERELACTLGDLLIRRTHVAFETRDNGRAVARQVGPFVAPVLGWDAPRLGAELTRYDAEVARIFAVNRER